MRGLGCALFALASCGRIGFDDLLDGGGGSLATPMLVSTNHAMSNNGAMVSIPNLQIGSGNLLVAAIISYVSTTPVTSVGDDFGNTYASTGATSTSSVVTTEIWYATHSVAGDGTLAVQLGSGTGAVVWLGEFSGVAASAPVDGVGSGAGGEVTSIVDSPAAHVSGSNDLVVSVLEMSAGGIDGVAQPFIALATVEGDDAAYGVVSGPGSSGAQWTAEGSGSTCSSTASFRPASQ